jgi:hypothetical protein
MVATVIGISLIGDHFEMPLWKGILAGFTLWLGLNLLVVDITESIRRQNILIAKLYENLKD